VCCRAKDEPDGLRHGGRRLGQSRLRGEQLRARGAAIGTSVAFSNTQGGWVAGGGLEWMIMITNNWLLRGEFLYYSLNNSPSVVVTPAIHSALPSGYSWSNTNVIVARAALSYKF
jgi:hypothetical protein